MFIRFSDLFAKMFMRNYIPPIIFASAVFFLVLSLYLRRRMLITISAFCMVAYGWLSWQWHDVQLIWLIGICLGVSLMTLEVLVPGVQLFGLGGFLMTGYSLYRANSSLDMAILTLLLSVVFAAVAFSWQRSRGRRIMVIRKLVLQEKNTREKGFVARSSQICVGDIGRTVSPLRPVGYAEFGGQRLEVVTDEGYLPVETDVIVVGKQSMKVEVRRYIR